MTDAEPLTPEVFDGHLNTEFRLAGPDGTEHALTLVAVDRLGPGPAGHREPFSLQFVGAEGQLLPQQTHPLRHAELGELEIFLVPLGPIAGAMCYEAVFG